MDSNWCQLSCVYHTKKFCAINKFEESQNLLLPASVREDKKNSHDWDVKILQTMPSAEHVLSIKWRLMEEKNNKIVAQETIMINIKV